jgi:beta-lactamase superfamily II metal-dependent hydrolase
MGLLIDMIDVGQGDSFLLTIDSPSGEANVLIDAGLPEAGAKVLGYIQKYAPRGLDLIIATHIDNDHIGGLATVLAQAPIKEKAEFVLNVPPAIKNHWTPVRNTLEKYKGIVAFRRLIEAVDAVKSLSALANKRRMVCTEALQGRRWTCGNVGLTVINPTAQRLANAWEERRLDQYIQDGWELKFVSTLESNSVAPSTSTENDSSIVIEISLDGRPVALMSSDAGAAVLREVTKYKQYTLLKVPHHGSDTGLDRQLIQQIRPSFAAIPVGDNSHGHPCIEVLDLLRENGTTTYCSSKTKNCRKTCAFAGGDVSFPFGKSIRPGWKTIDTTQCQNNAQLNSG